MPRVNGDRRSPDTRLGAREPEPPPETPPLVPQIEAGGRSYTPQELSDTISQQTEDLMKNVEAGLVSQEEYEDRYAEITHLTGTLAETVSRGLETFGIIPDLPKGTTIYDDEFFETIRSAPPEQQMRFLFWQDPTHPDTNPWRIQRRMLEEGFGLTEDSRGGGHRSMWDKVTDIAGDTWGGLIHALEWPAEQIEFHLTDNMLKDVLPNDEARHIVANRGFHLAFAQFADEGIARDVVNAYLLDTNLNALKRISPGKAPWDNLTEASEANNWAGIVGNLMARITVDPLWLIPPAKGLAGTALYGRHLMRNGWAMGKAGQIIKGTKIAGAGGKEMTVLPRLGRFLTGGPASSAARQMERMFSAELFMAARGETHQAPGILNFVFRRTPQGLGIETMRVTMSSVLEPWFNDATKSIDDLSRMFDDIAKAPGRDAAVAAVAKNGWDELAVNPETARFAEYMKRAKMPLLEEEFTEGVKALRQAGMDESFIRRMTMGHVLERHAPSLANQLQKGAPRWYNKVVRPFAAAQKRVMSVMALSAPRFITLNIGYNGFIGLLTTAGKFPRRVLQSFRPFQQLDQADELARNITKVGGDAAVHDEFVANTTFLRDVLDKTPSQGIDLGDAQKLVDDVFGKAQEGATWGDRLSKATAFPVYLATNFIDMPTRRLVYGKALADALHFSEDFTSVGGLIDDLPYGLREPMPDWAVNVLLDEVRQQPMTADGVRAAVAGLERRLLADDGLTRLSANMLKDRFVKDNMGVADGFARKVAGRDFDESANAVMDVIRQAPDMDQAELLDEIGIIRDMHFGRANVIHEINNMPPVVSRGPGYEKARVLNMESVKQMAMDEISHIERLVESAFGGTVARAERGQLLRKLSRYYADDVGRPGDIWQRAMSFVLSPAEKTRITKGAVRAAERAGRGDEAQAFVNLALRRAKRSGRQNILKELDAHYAQSLKGLDDLENFVVGMTEARDWVSTRLVKAFFQERRTARLQHMDLIKESRRAAAQAGTREAEATIWEEFGTRVGRLYENLAESHGNFMFGWGPNSPRYNIGTSPVDRVTEMMAFKANQQDRFLEWVGNYARRDWDVLSGQKMDALPAIWREGLEEWAGKVGAQRVEHATAVKISAYERAAFSLTSYERQYGWDAIMQVFAPFEFFPSRILWNWGRRTWDNPAAVGMLWKFARSTDEASEMLWKGQAQEALEAYGLSEQDSKNAVKGMKLPNKFRHMVPVPMPFLSQVPGIGHVIEAAGAESLGSIGWIDPLAYTNPMEFYGREFYDDERRKSTPLGLAVDWTAQNTPFGPSPLWSQLGSMSGMLPERQAWTNTLMSGMPFGLPATRAARGLWSFMGNGNDLGVMSDEEKEFLVNNEYLPESLLRRVIGLPPGDEWEGYLIDRTMGSLMFTGDLDNQLLRGVELKEFQTLKANRSRSEAEQSRYLELRELRSARAIQALKDRDGPAYAKARMEASRERGLRDVTGWAGIRISPFLEGDLVARGLKVLHDQAAASGALTEFYDRYPEYQLRNVALSNFDKEDGEGRGVEIDNTLYWFDRNQIEAMYEETITELKDARLYVEAMDQTPEVQTTLRDLKAQLAATYDEMNGAIDELEEVYPLRKKEMSLFTDPKEKALRDLRTTYFSIELDPSIADKAQRWDDLEARQDAFLSDLPPRKSTDNARDWWDMKVTILREKVKADTEIGKAYDQGRFGDADKLKEERDRIFEVIHEVSANRVTRYDFELFLNGGWHKPTPNQQEFQRAQTMFDWLMALIGDDSPLSGREKAGLVDAYTADPTFQKYFGDRFLDPFETPPELLDDPDVQRYFEGAPRNQIPAAAIARRREIYDHYGNLDRGRPRTDYLRSILPELNTIQRILGLAPVQLFEPTPPKPRLPWLMPREDDVDDLALTITRRGY